MNKGSCCDLLTETCFSVLYFVSTDKYLTMEVQCQTNIVKHKLADIQ